MNTVLIWDEEVSNGNFYIEIQQNEEKMATIMLSDTDSQEYARLISSTLLEHTLQWPLA